MTDTPNPPHDLLLVGYVRKSHGVRGDVVVRLTTDRVERVDVGSTLVVGDTARTITSTRPHQGDHIVHFEGVDERNAADVLRGLELKAEPIEDPDVLWVHELIGSQVIDVDGANKGTVVEVLANPASDLLELDTGALVPLRFVTSNEPGVIHVDVPDGLFALYEEGEEE